MFAPFINKKKESVYPPVLIEGLKNEKIKEIASGDHHSLFLSTESGLWVTGSNDFFECGTKGHKQIKIPIKLPHFGNKTNKIIKSIHAGEKSSHVLLTNGQVYAWGSNTVNLFPFQKKIAPFTITLFYFHIVNSHFEKYFFIHFILKQ